MDPLRGHAVRRNVDDARRGALLEQRDQKVRQQEWPCQESVHCLYANDMAAGDSDRRHLRIGELSGRVGVNPEVLRAWERRYGLFSPSRTAGGFRPYGDQDERRVRRPRGSTGCRELRTSQCARSARGEPQAGARLCDVRPLLIVDHPGPAGTHSGRLGVAGASAVDRRPTDGAAVVRAGARAASLAPSEHDRGDPLHRDGAR